MYTDSTPSEGLETSKEVLQSGVLDDAITKFRRHPGRFVRQWGEGRLGGLEGVPKRNVRTGLRRRGP